MKSVVSERWCSFRAKRCDMQVRFSGVMDVSVVSLGFYPVLRFNTCFYE